MLQGTLIASSQNSSYLLALVPFKSKNRIRIRYTTGTPLPRIRIGVLLPRIRPPIFEA